LISIFKHLHEASKPSSSFCLVTQGKRIDEGVVTDAGEIARRERMDVTRVREILRLVIIDPRTANAIFEGRQPRTLSLEFLVRKSLPLDWELQRQRVAENGG
jgi:hypothetical protein